MMQRHKEEIEYCQEVQDRFYGFAQHGLTKEVTEEEDPEMGEILGTWWGLMITFARQLAALALSYGIKLSDVQEQCEVYLMRHFVLIDYVDDHYITTHEHAKRLLAEIDRKKELKADCKVQELPSEPEAEGEAQKQKEQQKATKPKDKSKKNQQKTDKQNVKPEERYTLNYVNPSQARFIRLGFVQQKLEEWKWMDETCAITPYESLFSGTDVDCKLNWIGNAPTLYLLMSELLKQPFIKKYKGCSASSIVTTQFSCGLNQHTERVSQDEQLKIKRIIFLLNPKSDIPMKECRNNEVPDITDETLAMVLSGELTNSSHT